MNILKESSHSNQDSETESSGEGRRDELLALRKKVVELTGALAKRTGVDAVRRLEDDENKSLHKQIDELTDALQVEYHCGLSSLNILEGN